MSNFIDSKDKELKRMEDFIQNPTITLVNGSKLSVIDGNSYRITNETGYVLGEKKLEGGELMLISQIVTLDVEVLHWKNEVSKLLSTKPPVGLRSANIVKLARIREIEEAIERYNQANLPIPVEWSDEYQKLND